MLIYEKRGADRYDTQLFSFIGSPHMNVVVVMTSQIKNEEKVVT